MTKNIKVKYTEDSLKKISRLLVPKYKIAKWVWGIPPDCRIPNRIDIENAYKDLIHDMIHDVEEKISTGGLFVEKTYNGYYLGVEGLELKKLFTSEEIDDLSKPLRKGRLIRI